MYLYKKSANKNYYYNIDFTLNTFTRTLTVIQYFHHVYILTSKH